MIMFSSRLNTPCNYAKATPSSRNMIVSQSVINSGMIIMCEATVKMSNKIELYVLYLQTSALTLYPYILTETFMIKNMSNTKEMEKFFDIVQMHCYCKADSSYSCKHVVAVLLFCNRQEHCYTEYKTQWLNNLNEKCECRKTYLENCNFMTGNATNI